MKNYIFNIVTFVTAFFIISGTANYSGTLNAGQNSEIKNSFCYRETVPGVKMRYIGPGAGGSMFGMGFHPLSSDKIIFGGDMGACYRTEDGGKNWNIIAGKSGNNPGATWNVKFHPANPDIVWQVGSGVYKSSDSGKTWQNMNAPPRTFGALGLDPDNTNIVYIAEGQAPRSVLNWCLGLIFKTVDGGKTWKKLSFPNGPSQQGSYRNIFTDFIIDKDSKVIEGEGHSRVYLFGRGGLFRSEDAGKTWKELSKSFAPGQVNDMVAVKQKGKTTLFLSVAPAVGLEKGGIYKSSDKGETWIAVNNGLENLISKLSTRNKPLKENPEAGIFALLLAHSDAAPNRIYAGSWQGIYRSDNSGESWRELIPAEGCGYVKDRNRKYTPIPKEGSHFETSIWGGMDHFNRFIIDQNNADRLAFSDNQDMYISEDGGNMWDSVSFDYGEAFDAELYPDTPPNRYTHKVISRGPQNLVCDQVRIDPFDPNTYYASYMDVGFQVSRDGGKSWEHTTGGNLFIKCPKCGFEFKSKERTTSGTPARGHAWTVTTDPEKQGRVYITIGQSYGQKGGIYISEDSARSWQRIGLDNAGMGKLQAVAIDLNSPVDNRTLYVGSEKSGIYKSMDGGKSWKNIIFGLSGKAKNITSLVIAPESSKIIYAGTGAGLFISTDRGKTWTKTGKEDFEAVKSISICRNVPSTMYISAHYPKQSFYWGRAGFWRSEDSGKTFTDITPSYFKFAGEVAVNPYDPDYIYGANNLYESNKKDQRQCIVRSKDGGKTWENISEYIATQRAVHTIIDDKDPRKFFVLTRFGIIEGYDSEAPVATLETLEK